MTRGLLGQVLEAHIARQKVELSDLRVQARAKEKELHRLSLMYRDDCLEFSKTSAKEYNLPPGTPINMPVILMERKLQVCSLPLPHSRCKTRLALEVCQSWREASSESGLTQESRREVDQCTRRHSAEEPAAWVVHRSRRITSTHTLAAPLTD
jgi:hypothetical protein